jgi:tetratricopeptide (TPR) repeat protein
MNSKIEALIEAEDWPSARRAIRAELRSSPKHHWLLTRLGLTYYEQRRYRRALEYALLALSEAPNCPLVLWDYAGTLQMLGQHQAALKVYRRLIRRGMTAIAFGECGEGLSWARGLVADCHYRIAGCYKALRRPKLAIKSLQNHLSLRGLGRRSIYPLAKIRRDLRNLQTSALQRSKWKNV